MRVPTEQQVRQADQLYQIRDSARTLLGEKFKPRMAEIGAMLAKVAEVRQHGTLEAAIAVCQHNDLRGVHSMLVLAAAVELTEPTP